jgi:hypothetical protein
MVVRSNSVRHQVPLRAPYSRQVLPHVRGFPTLGVLRLIRHPLRFRRACPLTVLLHLPAPGQELRGLPKFFDGSLPACRGLRTPTDLHILAFSDVSVLPSGALRPSASATSVFRSCPRTSGCTVTPTAYRILCLRCAQLLFAPISSCSALDARLDTGGWLTLTRPGLSPSKIRQAFLARERPALTASRPAVKFRFQQSRNRAAMRFRVEPAVAQPAPPQIRT